MIDFLQRQGELSNGEARDSGEGFPISGIWTLRFGRSESVRAAPFILFSLLHSAKPLPHQQHQFLLALVGLFKVIQELGELAMPVRRQQESVPGLGEEFDELSVMAGAYVGEAGVCGADVRSDGSFQKLAEWQLISPWSTCSTSRDVGGGK